MCEKTRIVTDITVTLSDGSVMSFKPKHETVIKIQRGTADMVEGNTLNKVFNGKESLIIVSAPQSVLNFFRDTGDINYWIEQELNKS